MCLVSKWRFPRKAKKDIVCYKALIKYVEESYYYSPFMFEIIDITKPLVAKGTSFTLFGFEDYYSKYGGYIHVFEKIPSLEFISRYFEGINNINIFKCIIPKGTKYHESKDGEYCARKLIIDSIIPSYMLK